LFRQSQEKLKYPPVCLEPEARVVVDTAIRQLADQRQWTLHELNVRSNHVHVAITASNETPEKVMADIKAKGTRALRENSLMERERKVWTEHGSTVYIFKEEHFHNACQYIREQ
jgi:REP element-mobilizing transposase RayT